MVSRKRFFQYFQMQMCLQIHKNKMNNKKLHVVQTLYSSSQGWDGLTFKITAPYWSVCLLYCIRITYLSDVCLLVLCLPVLGLPIVTTAHLNDVYLPVCDACLFVVYLASCTCIYLATCKILCLAFCIIFAYLYDLCLPA